MGIKIGTAGWGIPRNIASEFPPEGSGLERFSAVFPVAEINSSFHRPHRPSTWERWRDSVPNGFRFSVKLPKLITHGKRLTECEANVDAFLEQAEILGEKLAVLLVQLPPKLDFDARVAGDFFERLSERTSTRIACEPRHASWFGQTADDLLRTMEVSRVAADPAICPEAAEPGGSSELSYWRLHGSPVVYRSSYSDRLSDYAARLREAANRASEVWCIFDNTASSAGASDALGLMRLLNNANTRA